MAFQGTVLPSQSWILLDGVAGKPLRFHHMSDLRIANELREPVLSLYSLQYLDRDVLLVQHPSHFSFRSLPELKEWIRLPLEIPDEFIETPFGTQIPKRITVDSTLINSDWLLAVHGSRIGEKYDRSREEIYGWRWQDLLAETDHEHSKPDLRLVYEFDKSDSIHTTHLSNSSELLIRHGESIRRIDLQTQKATTLDDPLDLKQSKKLLDSALPHRHTNLKQSNWHLTKDNNTVVLETEYFNQQEVDALQYGRRFASPYELLTIWGGLMVWRSSWLPSASLLCSTVLLPSYFCLAFFSISRVASRCCGSHSRFRVIVLAIAALVCYFSFDALSKNYMLTRGGFWQHPIIAWSIPLFFGFAVKRWNEDVFEESIRHIASTVAIALPSAMFAWWLSFLIPMPANSLMSQLIATISLLSTCSVPRISNSHSPFTGISKRKSIKFRIPNWILNFAIGLQIIAFLVFLYAMYVLRTPSSSQGTIGLGFFILLLYVLVFWLGMISIVSWLLAWAYQAALGEFQTVRTTFAVLLFTPWIVTATNFL